MRIKVNKGSAALFTVETNKTREAPPAGREWICLIQFICCFISCRYFLIYTVVSQNWSQTILFLLQILQSNII